jgi:hypothetical protein
VRGAALDHVDGVLERSTEVPMQSITANDRAIALSDAFRCLVKALDKAGVVQLADLEKALQVQADVRRSAHEDGVAAATAFISSSLRW